MQHNKRNIWTVLSLIVMALLLSGCPLPVNPFGATCVQSDASGAEENQEFYFWFEGDRLHKQEGDSSTAYLENVWIPTGFQFNAGSQITLRVNGMAYQAGSTVTESLSAYTADNSRPEFNSSYSIPAYSFVDIVIPRWGGSAVTHSPGSPPSTNAWSDGSSVSVTGSNGNGMEIYIGGEEFPLFNRYRSSNSAEQQGGHSFIVETAGGVTLRFPHDTTRIDPCNFFVDNTCQNYYGALNGDYDSNGGGYQPTITYYRTPHAIGTTIPDNNTNITFEAVLMAYNSDDQTSQNPNAGGTVADNLSGGSVDGIFQSDVGADGVLWVRVRDTDGDYADNIGSFDLKITKSSHRNGFATMVRYVQDKLQVLINRTTHAMFTTITRDSDFGKAIRACLVLYIVIYCLAFTLSLVEVTQMDLVIRVFKFSLVYYLLSPDGGWTFFNEFLFEAFRSGILELTGFVAAGMGGSSENFFYFVDKTMGVLFGGNTWLKFLGMFFAGPVGWLYMFILIYGLWLYLWVIVEAVIAFFIALVAVGFIISIAPIFIVFILFGATKDYFSNWLAQLANFAMQPFFLLAMLAIVSEFIYLSFHLALLFTVCWDVVIELYIYIPLPGGEGFKVPLFNLYFFLMQDLDTDLLAITIPIIAFMLFVHMAEEILTKAPDIVGQIFGGGARTATSGRGSPANKTAQAMKENVKGMVGMDKDSQERRQLQREVDDFKAQQGDRDGGETEPAPEADGGGDADAPVEGDGGAPDGDGGARP